MIALGCDHGGYELKEEIKKYFEEIGIEYEDFGTNSTERTDYPNVAKEVAKEVQAKNCEKGILICRSGIGMSMVANKFKGIRAALGINEDVSRDSKADDNINVLVLPAQYVTKSDAIASVRAWIGTEFKTGRYVDRIRMIENIEKNEMK